jgi:hypothetical protein
MNMHKTPEQKAQQAATKEYIRRELGFKPYKKKDSKTQEEREAWANFDRLCRQALEPYLN